MTVVENRSETTRGGVTGRGFKPGQSGNPGGRPKGLSKRVRELVGEDGEKIVEFMTSVMADESARKADRLEAAKWLADRGFGRAIQGLEVDVAQRHCLDLAQVSAEDLEALLVIAERYQVDADEVVESGRLEIGSSALPTGQSAQRSRRA
jgi:hypothetical protein